jgi:hypothetical protein
VGERESDAARFRVVGLEPGEFKLQIGGCSPSNRGQELGAPKPVTAMFEVK